MKRYRWLIKVLATILAVPAGLFAGLVVFLMITDYHPSPEEAVLTTGKGKLIPGKQKEFTFFTWNIGYGGLGKGMDFFYEGGTRVRPEKQEFTRYFGGICNLVATMDSADFIFIQEADVHSKRSYYTDEIAEIGKAIPGRASVFAKNYDSRFVPVPLDDPMGRVVSGIACYPKYRPASVERIDYGTRFSWPKQLVMLKRCFMVMRYPLGPGKELVVVNLHNSTFDRDGKLRKRELLKLQSFVLTEYSKGNYVVAGGDWNNNPRSYRPQSILSGDVAKAVEPPLDAGFLPGWKFAFDSLSPTNRDVDMPYQKGKTKTTIIDFYVVSPNVEIKSVHTLSTGFLNSDHQPVFMKVAIK